MPSILPTTSVLCSVSGIATGNETGSPSDFLVDYLDFFGTIISIFNLSLRGPLTKALFLVTIEALIVFIKFH